MNNIDLKDLEYRKARNTALDFVSRKPRTEFEVRRRLAEKKTDDDIIEDIVLQLKEEKLIDDRDYVSEWLDLVAERRGYGKMLIFKKLMNLGVEESIINEKYLENYADKEKEIASREAILKLKFIQSGLSKFEIKVKLGRFLASRGFEKNLALSVMDQLRLG